MGGGTPSGQDINHDIVYKHKNIQGFDTTYTLKKNERLHKIS